MRSGRRRRSDKSLLKHLSCHLDIFYKISIGISRDNTDRIFHHFIGRQIKRSRRNNEDEILSCSNKIYIIQTRIIAVKVFSGNRGNIRIIFLTADDGPELFVECGTRIDKVMKISHPDVVWCL